MPLYPNGLSNPYGKSKNSKSHVITCGVSHSDYVFLKSRFPCFVGLFDVVLSTSFKQICDAIRQYESTHGPLPTAVLYTDPQYSVLLGILQGAAVGRLDRPAGSRDEPTGAGGICEVHGDFTDVGTDTQSSVEKGNGELSEEGEDEENGDGACSGAVEESGTVSETENLISLLQILKT